MYNRLGPHRVKLSPFVGACVGTTNKTFNHCHGLPFGIFACYNYHCYDESLEPEDEMSGGRPGFSYEDEEVCLVFQINL